MPPQRPERGDPALGLRLRELRLERGMTMAALAERIGVTQPAISQWESGRERPGRETLQRLAGALGVTAEALALRAGAQSATATLSPLQLPADVPVLGTAVGGDSGDFSFNGMVVDYVRRPQGVAQMRNIYALWVTGDSMAPWNRRGDLIYVTPTRPPVPGDHVVVELAGVHAHEAGTAMVKLLAGQTPTQYRLRQYNPERDFTIARTRVKAIHKVLSLRELMGI
ncbi:MAG: helix-turn-helix transcriptional regulator [Alphaproteobacteria bacterium]|jgi:phage repressor protein C with HTH and peptisase S24 domain